MSALTDLKARITGADGSLLDRGTIAAELERAIAEEGTRAQTEGYWWCPNCVAEVHSARVTFEERHQDCGARVEYIDAPAEPERAGTALMAALSTYLRAIEENNARPTVQEIRAILSHYQDEATEREVSAMDLARTFKQLTERREVKP